MIRRIAATAAVLLLAVNVASAQQPATKTLKMQATWPTSVTAWDNFQFLADRISKLTSGSLKIETLAAGQVVPAFETLDAVNRKVLDVYPKAVWLNPEPEQLWPYRQSIAVLREIFGGRMYPTTIDGLERAMRYLSK